MHQPSGYPTVKEVTCRTILSQCGLQEFSYSINPYTGCGHGCVYCYARFMGRYGHPKEEWGTFVDVKVNSPQVARKDLEDSKPGRIFLSSVTDPYQPLEGKYALTQKILGAIKDYGYPVSIFTKSSLVQRDLKVIAGMKGAEFWHSISILDEKDRKAMEPGSSPVHERLETLRLFSEAGIKSYVFVGPILPGITDRDLPGLFRNLREAGVREILADRLNIKCGNLQPIMKAIKEHYPDLVEKYKELFVMGGDSFYFQDIKQRMERAAKESGLRVDWCY